MVTRPVAPLNEALMALPLTCASPTGGFATCISRITWIRA